MNINEKRRQRRLYSLAETFLGDATEKSKESTSRSIGLGQAAAKQTEANMSRMLGETSNKKDKAPMLDRQEFDSTKAEQDLASWIASIRGLGAEDDPLDKAIPKGESKPLGTGSSALGIMKPSDDLGPIPDMDGSSVGIPNDLLGKKGGGGKAVSYSYFNSPIQDGELRGNSRKAGDASPEVQKKVIDMIIDTGRQMDLSDREIAIVLATARHESGFNPDAAATSTSAHGIGQFVNKTGEAYGLTDDNRWDVAMQVQALVDHTVDNIRRVNQAGKGEEYIYAIHHDGNMSGGPGLTTSRKEVMPYVDKYEQFLAEYEG